MSIQAPSSYPGLIWSETFNSEQSVRANGGVPTNVEFRNGKAVFSGNGIISLNNQNVFKLKDYGWAIRAVLINPTIPTGADAEIISNGITGNSQIRIEEDSGHIEVYFKVGGTTKALLSSTSIIENSKNDIFVTGNGTSMYLFLNGDYSGTTDDILNKEIFNTIGGFLTSRYLTSEIDFIEIYNRALSAEEIHNLHHGLQNVALPLSKDILLDYTSLNGVVENRVKYNPLGLGKQGIVGVFDASRNIVPNWTTEIQDFDISFCVYHNALGSFEGYFGYINQISTSINKSGIYARKNSNNTLQIAFVRDATNTVFLDSTYKLLAETWYKLRFTKVGSILSIYINNSLSISNDTGFSTIYYDATGKNSISGYNSNGNIALKIPGMLADFKVNDISNFPLSGDTIDQVSQLPATNNGVTFESIIATPTPTDITFKKLGSQHSAFFNGLTSGIDINYDIDATGDRTLMGWFNIHGLGGSGKGVICLIERIQFRLYGNTTTLVFYSTSVDFIYTPFELDYFTDYFFFIQRAADGETSMYLGTKDSPPTLAVSGNTGIPEGGSNNLIGVNASGSRSFHGLIPKIVLIRGILPLEQGIQAWSNTLKLLK